MIKTTKALLYIYIIFNLIIISPAFSEGFNISELKDAVVKIDKCIKDRNDKENEALDAYNKCLKNCEDELNEQEACIQGCVIQYLRSTSFIFLGYKACLNGTLTFKYSLGGKDY